MGAFKPSSISTQVAVLPSQMMFLSTKVNSAVQSSSLGNYTSWKEPENHDWSLYMGIFFPFIHSSSSKELLRDAAIRPVIAISTYQHLGGGGGGE